MYQFPLIESERSFNSEEFHLLNLKDIIINNSIFDYSLYNEADIVHKLSHQHLYTKFWIVEVDKLPQKAIPTQDLNNYPAPVLISDFINTFNFESL